MISSYAQKACTFLLQTRLDFSGVWVDCGCGQGYYMEALLYLGAYPVIGIDISIDIDHFSLQNIPYYSICGDGRALPLRDATARGILYVNVLHYFSNSQPLLEEAVRVLHRSGRVVIIEYAQSVPTGWNPHPLSVSQIKVLLSRNKLSCIRTLQVDTSYRPKNIVIGEKKEYL
ncbi:MAG: methyltransferase domain-containing protein [Theionarchaea archaeon]|nr:methyltransferase domain-containing protein [Theionarchaea archaeon]